MDQKVPQQGSIPKSFGTSSRGGQMYFGSFVYYSDSNICVYSRAKREWDVKDRACAFAWRFLQ